MRRRATITAVLLLALLGCDPHTTNQTAPTPTGNLCDRIRPTLPGNWTTKAGESWPTAPLSDLCNLVAPAQSTHQIQVLVSILPVTAAQAARYRKFDEIQTADRSYAAKVTDGGMGDGSWALNPAAAAPWLVFRTGNRQVRLRAAPDGAATMDELLSVAHAITAVPGGLPVAKARIVRPQCERGTAAAEHVIGGAAVARRDTLVDGHLWCEWGNETASVWAIAGDRGSDEAIDFHLVQTAGADPAVQNHRVTVGAEGWQQDDGYLVFRTARGQFVIVSSAPYAEMKPVPIVMLARAIAPAYS
ncbi:hypothetical protein ACFV9C_40700 [Kribbella sp. NPDC059898]|uniref:hypothetical protein n=1 Tax=Kribbella sp. NPDC059898 TaxID=3346995 RepID=UPI00365DB3C9